MTSANKNKSRCPSMLSGEIRAIPTRAALVGWHRNSASQIAQCALQPEVCDEQIIGGVIAISQRDHAKSFCVQNLIAGSQSVRVEFLGIPDVLLGLIDGCGSDMNSRRRFLTIE
jgi:hypothetical protein